MFATVSSGSQAGEIIENQTVADNKPTSSNVPFEPLSTIKNVELKDDYGNKIIVPSGFRISYDSETNITKGIVIEDEEENQFVWIPVGKIYTTNANNKEENAITINLSRYEFLTGANSSETRIERAGDYGIKETEGHNCTETEENSVAINIENFKDNTIENGGYYISRFEAGYENEKNASNLKVKAGLNVFNNITRNVALELSQGMYQSNNYFTCDLINSFAFDTALIFIEKFGTDNDYAHKKGYTINSSLAKTGENNDIQCNIHDLCGNIEEWDTEFSIHGGQTCVGRGSGYRNHSETVGTYRRGDGFTSDRWDTVGFRTIIYFN